MPSIQDFKGSQKAAESTSSEAETKTSSRRRRPGFEVESEVDSHTEAEKPEGFRLEFTGSEYLRHKAPKAFALAEVVVDEWKKDGDFQRLPISHPLAGMAAKLTLTRAKQVEKKLEEKGVFALAKMGMAYAKSKIQRS